MKSWLFIKKNGKKWKTCSRKRTSDYVALIWQGHAIKRCFAKAYPYATLLPILNAAILWSAWYHHKWKNAYDRCPCGCRSVPEITLSVYNVYIWNRHESPRPVSGNSSSPAVTQWACGSLKMFHISPRKFSHIQPSTVGKSADKMYWQFKFYTS